MSYWSDQKIREDVRRKIQALRYNKGTVARAVIADDALDALGPLTLKTEDGQLVKVEPFGAQPRGAEQDRYYRIVPEDQPCQ